MELQSIKSLKTLLLIIFVYLLSACSGAANSMSQDPVSSVNKSGAKTEHQDGWTIISKEEDGDRVYWFLAPDVDNVSPAMFKKIIHTNADNKHEIKTVSQCDAPKKLCDDLMKKFKTLSESYR
jgi:hypothetical protein